MASLHDSLPVSRPHHRAPALLLVLLFGAASLILGAGSAAAADGYKYWNYFHVKNGSYAFAQTGASDFTPKDGAVEAYRYGTSTAADGLPPRADLTTYSFAKVCAGTPTQSGEKRVAVLLDFGTKADAASGDTPPAPRAACATVPSDADGQQVLGAVAQVRAQKGLTCGIDGYPTSTCSVTVKDPGSQSTGASVSFALPAAAQPSASPSSGPSQDQAGGSASSDSSSSSSSGGVLVTVGVLVLVLALAGVAFARSRRSGSTD